MDRDALLAKKEKEKRRQPSYASRLNLMSRACVSPIFRDSGSLQPGEEIRQGTWRRP